MDDAVLKVVRPIFKETSPVRFEGNNYSEEWVKEAAKRGLLEPAPHAGSAGAARRPSSRASCSRRSASSSESELESRYHVRLERYIKDMLIEMHTLREMVDTLVLPAAFAYSGKLAEAAAQAKSAGIKSIPQIDAANKLGALIIELQKHRAALGKVIDKAEGMHDELVEAGGAADVGRRGRDGGGAEVLRRARARRWPTSAGRCRSTGRCCSRCEQSVD